MIEPAGNEIALGMGTASIPGQPSPKGLDSAGELCPDTVAAFTVPASAESSTVATLSPVALAAIGLPDSSRRAVVEPLSPGRYKVQFTASAGLRDKLERLQALMRFQLPEGDLAAAAVIEAAVSEKLERLEARRFAKRSTSSRTNARNVTTTTTGATSKPASSNLPLPTVRRVSRHIPAAIRRAVYERDGGRCRYVDKKGRRCTEQHRLEFHHHHPYGLGGSHTLEDVRLMCRSHNLLVAEQDYGPEAMAAYRLSM